MKNIKYVRYNLFAISRFDVGNTIFNTMQRDYLYLFYMIIFMSSGWVVNFLNLDFDIIEIDYLINHNSLPLIF